MCSVGSRVGMAYGRVGLGGGDRHVLLGLHGMHYHLGCYEVG